MTINKQALRNSADRDWFEEWFKKEYHPNKTGPYIKDQMFFAIQAARAPLLDELEAAQKSNEFLKEQLAQLASFNPDWDKLEAATDSIREHMVELIAARNRIAELEARTPYGYLRQCDGQIQISIGREQPHNRSGGYATPWFAIYTAAGISVKGE